MRILDRYLLREFLSFALLGVLAFILLFIVTDLTEKLDIFVDSHAPLHLVLRYYLFGLPTMLTEVLPIALLLGTLMGLSGLRKNNELTAMQSSGQSPWRLARPLLAAALLISVGQYVMNETIGPKAYETQRRVLSEEIRHQTESDRESRAEVRLIGSGGRFYYAQFYNARAAALTGVSVQTISHSLLLTRIDAERAYYANGVWRFESGTYREFGDSTQTALPFSGYGTNDFTEIPEDFAKQNQDPFHMSMRDLLRYAARVRESGGAVVRHLTNFHIRASFPLANLVMVLLGTALSLRVIRGGNVALGFGISVSIGFAYFAFIRVGQALGYSGTLPPMLAAWLGNLVFSTLGGLLFWKVTR